MIKLVPPKPFFYKGGEKAVLLLHSFTSNTMDMKKLGEYLHKENYSCYAPLYSGHGLTPEELLTYSPSDWWQDVLNGYQLLKDEGFKKNSGDWSFSWRHICIKSWAGVRCKWCRDNVSAKP